jgi:hypothetical protein
MVIITRELEMGSSRGRSAPMGYALWEFTPTGWNLRKNASVPGGVPGNAPRAAGQFIGQIRASPCVAEEK